MVDIYRDAKRGGIYPPLFTNLLLSTDLVNANNHYSCQLIQEKYNTVILEVPNC